MPGNKYTGEQIRPGRDHRPSPQPRGRPSPSSHPCEWKKSLSDNYYSTPPFPPASGEYGGGAQAGPPAPPRTNSLALVAFVGSFVVSLVGIVCGHIALRQISRTGERGHGFALAGLIIGYVALGVTLAISAIALFVGVVATSLGTDSSSDSSGPSHSSSPTRTTDPATMVQECLTAATATTNLTSELNKSTKVAPTAPATARAALASATATFASDTKTITDPRLQAGVTDLVTTLGLLDKDLGVYQAAKAAGNAQPDLDTLNGDLDVLRGQVAELQTICQ
jgi:hypothetical protein